VRSDPRTASAVYQLEEIAAEDPAPDDKALRELGPCRIPSDARKHSISARSRSPVGMVCAPRARSIRCGVARVWRITRIR